MVSKFFYLLPEIYEINNGNFIKYLILILIEKIFSFSNKKEISSFLKNTDFPAFISKLTVSNDLMKISFFLLISEASLQKLPELFIAFLREGIIDFIEKLSLEEEMNFLQIFPLFKSQAKFNPNNFDFKKFKHPYNKDFLNKDPESYKDFPVLEKGIDNEQMMEEEFFTYDFLKEKAPMQIDPNQILQTIQKDSKETEETLKEIEQEINSQSTEKNKYLELFQKFKKTKEKIQQTAELLQKTHKNIENTSGLNPEKKELNKPILTEAEQNLEKIKEIKIELNKLAKKILFQVKTSKDYNSLDISSTNEIMTQLNEINTLLKKNNNPLIHSVNDEDYGLKPFQIFINVLDKYNRITLHELKNSNIVKGLLDFLMDGALQKIPSSYQKAEDVFQEEIKMNQEVVEKKNEEINLNNHQTTTILKRVFIFISVFLKKSPMNPQG